MNIPPTGRSDGVRSDNGPVRHGAQDDNTHSHGSQGDGSRIDGPAKSDRLLRVGSSALVLSAVWAAATVVLWLAALLWLASASTSLLGAASEAALTTIGLVGLLISFALRLSDPFERAKSDRAAGRHGLTDDERIWLLAWCAQINVLGSLALMSPSLVAVLPAALVTLTTEWLLLPIAPAALRDWWLEGFAALSERQPRGGSVARSTDEDQLQSDDERDHEHEEDEQGEEVTWLRCARLGAGPTGELFLSGWLLYDFSPGEKSIHLTVAFTPSLGQVPHIELDLEEVASDTQLEHLGEAQTDGSSCEADIEHVTPAGMRIVIRRSASESSCQGKLHWHASGPDEAEVPASASLLKTRLP